MLNNFFSINVIYMTIDFFRSLSKTKHKAVWKTPNPILKQLDNDDTAKKAKIKIYLGKCKNWLTPN